MQNARVPLPNAAAAPVPCANLNPSMYNMARNEAALAAKAVAPQCNITPNQVPTPTEVDCIEVPKVFDECLVRQCLAYIQGADPTNPIGSDGLRQTFALTTGDQITGVSSCYGFQLTGVNIVENVPPINGLKNFTVTFNIVFNLDINSTDVNGANPTTTTVTFTVPRTINNILLDCPEPVSMIWTQVGTDAPVSHNQAIKKIVVAAQCMESTATIDAAGLVTVDVRLGFDMIIKCEYEVQLMVLSTGYCPTPEICENTGPCQEFLEGPSLPFYPGMER